MKSLINAIGSNLLTRYTDLNLKIFLEEASAQDPRTKNKACISEKHGTGFFLDVREVTVKSEITHSD